MDIDPGNLQPPNTSNIGQISGHQLPASVSESIPLESSTSNLSVDSLPTEEVCEFAK